MPQLNQIVDDAIQHHWLDDLTQRPIRLAYRPNTIDDGCGRLVLHTSAATHPPIGREPVD